jgi:hypothetical protein
LWFAPPKSGRAWEPILSLNQLHQRRWTADLWFPRALSRSGFTITAVTFNLRYLLLNCRQPGACLLVRQMQIARCGRAFARRLRRVSHNDRDWLDVYRAAVMEFDRDKLPASIDVAEKAIHQCLRGLPIANSKQHRKLRDALNSLAVLKRML